MTTTTSNMNLVLPDVNITTGPQWAALLNAAYALIDSHNHSTGQGVAITPSGLNISSDLPFNQNNATNLRSARLFNNASISLGVNDKTCLYSLNNELYYVDGAGNNVQITTNGTLNISSSITALTLKDSGFFLEYFGDTTRQMRFDVSAIPTATTRIISIPDSGANDTVLTRNATQVVSNKTIGAGNTLTGATAANLISGSGQVVLNTTGTQTLQNATDIVVSRNTSDTLTNKLLAGNTNTISSFSPNGGTNLLTTPAITDVIVTKNTVDTLTNKSLVAPVITNYQDLTEISTPSAPAAGVVRVYSKSDNNVYYQNASGLEQQIGSGSTSGINYITNAGFENGTVTGWVTYANTAQSTPVNGTGGSPSVTFAVSTSSPLRGTYSGLFTKGAVNYQGQGVSYAFTLAPVDAGKTLQLTFDALASAALVTGDMGVYLYDVTNGILITPSSVNIPTGTSSQYSVAMQTTTSTSYRLIFHVASTNASAYTLQLDQMSLSPVVRPMVAGESDWISYTPTFSAGFGTTTNVTGKWRRVGDSMHIMASCTAGTTASSLATVTLPGSFIIDSTKLPLNNTTASTGNNVGKYMAVGTTAGNGYVVTATGTATNLIYFGPNGTAYSNGTPVNGSSMLNSTNTFVFECTLPIVSWSSNITLASTMPAIEYVYNTTTSNASDTTSFGYGAQGGQIPAVTTSNKSKRVRFQAPKQPMDRVVLQFSNDSGVTFRDVSVTGILASQAMPFNGSTYGADIQQVSGSNTDFDVTFYYQGRTTNSSTFGGTSTNLWTDISANSTFLWRVVKYSSIGASELAPATSISTGTISRENIWTAYTPTLGTGFGTATSISFFYKVLGDSLLIRGTFATGTVAASLVSISIPSNFTISNGKIPFASATTSSVGAPIVGTWSSSTTNSYGSILVCAGSSTSLVYFGNFIAGSSGLTTAQNGSGTVNSTAPLSVNFEVPLV